MDQFLQNHPVKTAQRLFVLNAAIWLVIGVTSLIRYTDDKGSDNTATMVIIAVMMFGNVAAMLVSGWGLDKRRRWLYGLALGVLTVNILLTVTDQVGLADLITLIIDLILLWILTTNRRHFV